MDGWVLGVIVIGIVLFIAVMIGLSKPKDENTQTFYNPEDEIQEHYAAEKEARQREYDDRVAKRQRELEELEEIDVLDARNAEFHALSEKKAEADNIDKPRYRITRDLETLKYVIEEVRYKNGSHIMDIEPSRAYWHDYGLAYSYDIEDATKQLNEWESEYPDGYSKAHWTKILYEYDTYQMAEEALATFIAMESEDTTEVKYYDRTAKRA